MERSCQFGNNNTLGKLSSSIENETLILKTVSTDRNDVECKIRKNSQSLGQLSPIEIISDESFRQLSPDSKKTYLLHKKTYSLESRFNTSTILVTDYDITEESKISFSNSSVEIPYFGIMF